MNKVILIGNLTKTPELTTTTNGISVARFTLAVRRKFQNQNGEYDTDFINIVVWRTLAENCNKYLKKGSKCAVIGQIQNRSYDAQDGTKRYVTEVIADEVEFLSTSNSNDNIEKEEPVILEPIKDEDLPF